MLAILLLLVGIAMAYETFFRETSNKFNGKQYIKTDLNNFSEFVFNMSSEFPILYGLFSIVLAISLGALVAVMRRFISNYRKKIKTKATA